MALPNIPGLYDTVTESNGMKIGSTLQHIYDVNGQNFEWFDRLASLVYNQYSAPYFRLPYARQHGGEWDTSAGTDFYEELGSYNRTCILCVGASSYAGYDSSFMGQYKFRNINRPSLIYTRDGTGANGLACRVIIESDTKEHYIMVPVITARTLEGQLISNVDFKTYVEQYSSTHPYITGVNAGYYYKADFTVDAISSFNMSFTLMPMFTRSFCDWLFYTPQHAGRPHYIGNSSGKCLVTNTNGIIVRVPLLSTTIVDNQWSSALADTTGTHAAYSFQSGSVADNRAPFFYITLTQAVEMINSVGMWWGESQEQVRTEAKGQDTTSNAIHAPKITKEGATTTGDFKGTEIQQNWNNPSYIQLGGVTLINNNINPQAEPDRTEQGEDPDPIPNNSNILNLDTPTYTGVGCFATYYYMSKSMLNVLNNELWTSDDDTITAIIEGLKFYGSDPMQAIMSLRLYPFDISSYVTTTSLSKIKLGRFEMQYASGYIISANATCILDLGQIFIKPSFGDFRDYAPYTQIQLYVPFIGFIKINTNEFMNHMLKIQMVVDLTTGACESCIYADSRPMAYQSGNIGVEIPITLNNMTQVSTAIMQGILSFGSEAILGSAEDILFHNGTPAGIGANGQLRTDNAEPMNFNADLGEIGNIAAQVVVGSSTTSQSGKSSPACNLSNPLLPYLIISRPTWEKPQNYEHTYGKVCHTSGLISSFSGFTVCRNVDVSGINCTELEQNMIKSLLESGVYL